MADVVGDVLHDVEWLATHSDGDEVVFRIGRRGASEVVAEWNGIARLFAQRDGSASRFETLEGAAEEDLQKRAGTAKLLLRSLLGEVALHGAVVGEHGRGVVLLGRSRHGKSTLSAMLCAMGASLWSDDAAALSRLNDGGDDAHGSWVAHPSEQQHWLDGGARRALGDESADPTDEKWGTHAERVGEGNVSIVAFVDLAFSTQPDSKPTLRKIDGVEALASLVPQAVRFILDDPDRHRRELEMLARLVSEVPVYRLERPRSFALLKETALLTQRLLQTPSTKK